MPLPHVPQNQYGAASTPKGRPDADTIRLIFTAFLLVGLPFREKPWYRRRVVVPGSLVIAAVGLYWVVQRVFF